MFEQMLVHWIKDQTESDGVNFRRPWICNSFNTSICVDLISNTLPFCQEEYIEPIISSNSSNTRGNKWVFTASHYFVLCRHLMHLVQYVLYTLLRASPWRKKLHFTLAIITGREHCFIASACIISTLTLLMFTLT